MSAHRRSSAETTPRASRFTRGETSISYLLALLALLAACGPSAGSAATEPTPPSGPPATSPPADSPPEASPPAPLAFTYSTLPVPADPLRIVMLGGTSKNDVWAIARSKDGKTLDADPWIVLHFDGTAWSPGRTTLSMTSFAWGIAPLGGATFAAIGGTMFPLVDPTSKGVPITIPHQLLGLTVVGTRVLVRSRQYENDTSGISPLFSFDGTKFEPLDVPSSARAQAIDSLWGLGDDDRWIARSMAQKNTEGAAYLPLPLIHVAGTKVDSFDDVLAVAVTGVADDDVWAATANDIRHFDGTTWTITDTSMTYPGALVALSKDEVFVQRGPQGWGTSHDGYDAEGNLEVGDHNVDRFDGNAFVEDVRPGAPKRVGPIGRVGKSEVWFVQQTTIARLAPSGT